MAERSLGRGVRNLVLALLNATLVLAALCLWMAWGALSAAERVSGQIEEAARTVLRVRAEIVTLTEEIAATRAELSGLRSDGATDGASLATRIAWVEAELARLTEAVAGLGADPEVMIDRAVASAFGDLGDAVAAMLRGLRGGEAPPGS